jgi:hypothetical protein
MLDRICEGLAQYPQAAEFVKPGRGELGSSA